MKTPKRILERRRATRVSKSLSFTIGHDDFEIEAKTINISTTGVMCLVSKDIALMTQLQILLELPAKNNKNKAIEIKGVVVRKEQGDSKNKFYIAIFFSDIKPKDLALLESFIDGHLPQ